MSRVSPSVPTSVEPGPRFAGQKNVRSPVAHLNSFQDRRGAGIRHTLEPECAGDELGESGDLYRPSSFTVCRTVASTLPIVGAVGSLLVVGRHQIEIPSQLLEPDGSLDQSLPPREPVQDARGFAGPPKAGWVGEKPPRIDSMPSMIASGTARSCRPTQEATSARREMRVGMHATSEERRCAGALELTLGRLLQECGRRAAARFGCRYSPIASGERSPRRRRGYDIDTGWLVPPDPQGPPGVLRWWDGQVWSDHRQPMPSNAPAPVAEAVPAKRQRFSKRAAVGRVEELEALVDKHGLRQFGEIDEYRARVDSEIEAARAAAASEQAALQKQWDDAIRRLSKQHDSLAATNRSLSSEIEAQKREVVNLREAATLQELGVFDYEHPPTESSAVLAGQLEVVRGQIKDAVRTGKATTASQGFTFDNSAAKGRKFVNDMSKILLRAYNAEAENAVKMMRAGNLFAAQQRLSKVAEQIARQGTMIDLKITPYYQQLRLQELELANRHLRTVQEEKERAREHRAELREQRKAEQELAREHERLAKEKSHYLAALAALEAKGDLDGAARMREKLADVDRAIEDVDYRAANIRAGYVYVISNVGAFGENMVKIGMTRRLEPMDRVNELGDASVPFRFDVHALFFADDAVGVENMLHTTFAKQRVNKVNLRREYFHVTPAQVLDALKAHNVEVIEYTIEPAATEYRASTSSDG